MNLKEFVEKTLSEILDGIKSAQKKDGGEAVAALSSSLGLKTDNLAGLGTQGYLTIIDFDVLVAAENVGGAKAGIRVMGFGGAEGGGQHKSSESSRVKFSVPVVLPKGSGDNRADKNFNRAL